MQIGGTKSKRMWPRALVAAASLLVVATSVLVTAPAARALTIVNLSGTLQIGGAAQAGSVVTFNGTSGTDSVHVSTTTDANGNWVLHPFAGTVGALTVNDGFVTGTVDLSVGSSDQVENVDIPTNPATDQVSVLDGNGNPVAGSLVTGTTQGQSFVDSTATSDGSPLTWSIPAFGGLALCKTDSTGTCTFPTLLRLSGTLTAQVTDPYGSDSSYPTTFTGQTTTTIDQDASTATITVDWTHSLVDLSGAVTSSGSPVAGASVSFDGLSTTSDANGGYTLHPFPGSSGTLSVASGASATSMALTVGNSDQQQDVSLPPPAQLVNLSGTIDLGSAPAGGATVSLGGISTTADASGHYTLSPAAGTTGSLQVSFTQIFPYFASAPVVVGSTDQTDDVTIPTGLATVDVDVVDSNGNPLGGVPVQGVLDSQTSPVLGTTSDGSPVTWGLSFGGGVPLTVCTTGSDGTCSYEAPANLEGTISVSTSPFGSDPSYPQRLTDSVSGTTTGGTTSFTLTVPTASVVALSGTVTINGKAVQGATVSLGGIHATTDANGHYLLHPFAGTNGTIAVDDNFVHETFPVIVGNQDQTDDLAIADPDAVTLSGSVVLGSAANPDGPGVSVSFDGISASTDSSGNYSMLVPTGVSGTLTTLTGGVLQTTSPLTIGTSDQTEDLTIPTSPTTATVRTVDGSGNSLPDVAVNLSVPGFTSPITGTTSSGATLTWSVSGAGGSCTTGPDGSCSFAGLTNIVGTLSASLQLVPGDSSYPTLQASYTGSAPEGGSSVTLAFPNVGYVPSAGSATGSVLVAATGTSTVQQASSSEVPPSLLPPGTTAPVGSIAYAVHSVPVGGSVDVYVQLPPGTVPSAIYKLNPDGSLTDVTSLATISGNTITMLLTDGGPADADGVANGVIVDPLIPVTGAVGSGFRVSTVSLPAAARGHSIAPTTLSVAGKSTGATLKWKKVSLPKGLKLTSGGVLSGTPSAKLAAGNTHLVVRVTETVVTREGKKKVKTTTTVTGTISLALT